MLRPYFRTARPDDWAARLTDLVAFLLLAPIVIICLLVRLPVAWVELVGGFPMIVRVALLLLCLYAWDYCRAIVHALLPQTPYLLGRTLYLREPGRRVRVRARDIVDIQVELRTPGMREVIVLELRDGSLRDLCPTDWPGAGRLFVRLARLAGLR
ncbi:MAG: hypothetical protein KC636_03170, partial [Myxococcales bacterium]|nr:hypothetical protein [Myxococcales bacterium]